MKNTKMVRVLRGIGKWAETNPVLAAAIIALFGTILIILSTIGPKVVAWGSQSIPRQRLVATISHIDVDTGVVAVEFYNSGNRDATVSGALFTILAAPPDKLRPITSTNLLEVARSGTGTPVWKPAHVGLMRDTNECVFTIEILKQSELVVPAGKQVSTNLSPIADALRQAVEIFEDDTPLEFGIRFSVLDSSRHPHNVRYLIGTYIRNRTRSDLKPKRKFPWSLQLLPTPPANLDPLRLSAVKMTTNLTLISEGVYSNQVNEIDPTDGMMLFFSPAKPYVVIDPALLNR